MRALLCVVAALVMAGPAFGDDIVPYGDFEQDSVGTLQPTGWNSYRGNLDGVQVGGQFGPESPAGGQKYGAAASFGTKSGGIDINVFNPEPDSRTGTIHIGAWVYTWQKGGADWDVGVRFSLGMEGEPDRHSEWLNNQDRWAWQEWVIEDLPCRDFNVDIEFQHNWALEWNVTYVDGVQVEHICIAESLVWDGGDGLWADAKWNGGGLPKTGSPMIIDAAGGDSDVTVDADFNSAVSVAIGENHAAAVRVDPDVTLTVDNQVTVGAKGTLSAGGTLSAATVTVAEGGTLSGGTIAGSLEVAGILAPGPGIATLNHSGGDMELTGDATYIVDIHGATHDQVIHGGNSNLFLDGTLDFNLLSVGNVDPFDENNNLEDNIYPILQIDDPDNDEGEIKEEFGTITAKVHVAADWGYPDVAPDPRDPSPAVDGHLGDGVFFRGLENTLDEGSIIAVNAKLFIARAGDGNADTKVDGADISQLVARFNSDASYPRNRFWFDMDTAGDPTTDRSDGYVDGADISALVAGWTGDPGPAEEGTAVAEYDPATGEFTVSVENVMSWTLRSDGKFTAAADALPLGDATNLVSGNENTVGEGGFGAAMSYSDVLLGALTDPGTDASEFTIEYVTGYGQPLQRGSVTVIPEPGTVIMLLSGLLGLAVLGWRRRRAA